ncbi:MAG: hypothetical protein GX075_03780 [Firmicutes bacterium]|nr:hypothetical protein [Bacillota bacterium]
MMIRFKRIFFMLSIMLVVFSNECIVHGESTPSAIIYNLRSTRGNTVTKTFTLSQDTQVQYSYTTDFEDDGYIIISGPNGQIHHRDRNIGNLYADSFPGLKGATYTVKVNGGEYYDDEDYEYDYGDVNLTIKYYELNTNTMMYDFKLSGPYSDDSNCSETYNLYLPTDSISTG